MFNIRDPSMVTVTSCVCCVCCKHVSLFLSVVKAGYRFNGAAAPCSGVQAMYKLHAAAFAQCILLPTLQNVGVKLQATF